MTRKKKQGKENPRTNAQENTHNATNYNKFQILQQQKEDYEENTEEGGDPANSSMEAKEVEMMEGEEEEVMVTTDKTSIPIQMETESQKEVEVEEERIMRKLIQEWKNLDDRFIRESQKKLYKEAFKK